MRQLPPFPGGHDKTCVPPKVLTVERVLSVPKNKVLLRCLDDGQFGWPLVEQRFAVAKGSVDVEFVDMFALCVSSLLLLLYFFLPFSM